MRSINLKAILALALSIAACDSGELSDPPLEYQGYFVFFHSDNGIQVFANFVKQTVHTSVPVFQEHWVETVDGCEVTTLDPNTDPEQSNPDTEEPPPLVSAGETLTITSDSGTFATLTRSTGTSPAYSTEFSEATIPANIVLDIPGDVFPAFSNITIPQTPPVEFIQPIEANGVTPTTTLEWVTGNNPYSTLSFSALGYDPMTGISLRVACILVDDGSFSFPENIQLQMGEGFQSTSTYVSRRAISFAQNGDALLVITTGSSAR